MGRERGGCQQHPGVGGHIPGDLREPPEGFPPPQDGLSPPTPAFTLCTFLSLGGRLSRIIFMAFNGGSLK